MLSFKTTTFQFKFIEQSNIIIEKLICIDALNKENWLDHMLLFKAC